MHRFFVEEEQIKNGKVQILGSDVKHIKDVLRLRIGEEIHILSREIKYICNIEEILKDMIIANIIDKESGTNEPKTEIILYQGVAKGNKMDFILQKGTEVGIKKFVPIMTQRTIVKIKDIKKEKNRIDRWSAITEEAAKQSKRDRIPEVGNILDFHEMIEDLKGEENIIIPYEAEDIFSLKEALNQNLNGKIHLIIGPEGGFETDEIEKLKEIGGKIVTLGPRILRTETAGIVASAIILYELGDI